MLTGCGRLPPNVKFEVDDIESPWLHERPFDYIFMRYMCVCILDWPKLTTNIYKYVYSLSQAAGTKAYLSRPQLPRPRRLGRVPGL